jgi:hypothetical protein
VLANCGGNYGSAAMELSILAVEFSAPSRNTKRWATELTATYERGRAEFEGRH